MKYIITKHRTIIIKILNMYVNNNFVLDSSTLGVNSGTRRKYTIGRSSRFDCNFEYNILH